MKKLLYFVIIIGVAVGGWYIYKSFTAPVVNDVQLTDEIEEIEGEEDSEEVEENAEETQIPSSEEMENFDANEVPVVSKNETNEEVEDEVKDMIDERNTQPKDDGKLTEEDIDLMEKIIQKVQDLGK